MKMRAKFLTVAAGGTFFYPGLLTRSPTLVSPNELHLAY
jgi:hypothetical protein